jgi:glycosyltransferase involved in cell wall biosynthesis
LLKSLLFSTYNSIIISASSVSTYRLLRLIFLLRPNVLSRIVYVVIGGYFPEAIKSGRFNSNIYNNLKVLIVEGEFLRNQLLGFITESRVKVIPNFKDFPIIDFPNKIKSNRVKFVFVGRISATKGVSDILEATKIIVSSNPSLDIVVDFYGPPDELFNNTSVCSYRGYLDFYRKPLEAYGKLNSYDCLLFPTSWRGEGFPGVVIDAYVAGLPVIATDWNMNFEIIKNKVNGLIIPPKDIKSLVNSMLWVINNIDHAHNMGLNNHKIALNYHIDNLWDPLFENIL